jgi:iron(III) transport system ATP-binding protein
VIKFQNVSHTYGRHQSVTDISFQIESGQVVTLLGPSGCGKTTLLRLAAGFETPFSGQVAQDGNILSSPTILVAP